MCCTTGSHSGTQGWRHQHTCACGCLGVEFPKPRFMTKKQRIVYLEQHLEDLREEVTAVEEVIADIKKER